MNKQELLPGVYCGTSLSLCENGHFQCLVLNLTQFPIARIPIPKLEKPPTIRKISENCKLFNSSERLARLSENLRLDHITEGADTIRTICRDIDIFKLPGDKLTATSAAVHCIPTPGIHEGRAITLKKL